MINSDRLSETNNQLVTNCVSILEWETLYPLRHRWTSI